MTVYTHRMWAFVILIHQDGTVTWQLSSCSFTSCLQLQKEKDMGKSVPEAVDHVVKFMKVYILDIDD